MLPVACCCLLSVVCRLSLLCSLLLVGCCLLSAACGLSSVVRRLFLTAVCSLLTRVWCLVLVTCFILGLALRPVRGGVGVCNGLIDAGDSRLSDVGDSRLCLLWDVHALGESLYALGSAVEFVRASFC
jgi:hypothetical protein